MEIGNDLKREAEKTLEEARGKVDKAKTWLSNKWYVAWVVLGFIVAVFVIWGMTR
jgi:hypothetical protein